MSGDQVWLVTGASRGLGVDIVRSALAAGHRVVATGRDITKVEAAVGAHDNLLVTKLDVTVPTDAAAATAAAVDRFGRIDVLVNNAGNYYAGFFEEISPEAFRAQVETNLFGPLNVTREVLPVMRAQRAGHVISISSLAGIIGEEFCAAYATSKFGLEGWMESIRFDIAPYGIHTTIVEPGFFKTELLVEGASTTWPVPTIDDYAERTRQTVASWKTMDGRQTGDARKLADGLVTLAALDVPPLRWVAGADAVEKLERKIAELSAQIEAHRELSCSLDRDDL